MPTALGVKELALCTVGNAGSRFGKKRKTTKKKEKRKERRMGK